MALPSQSLESSEEYSEEGRQLLGRHDRGSPGGLESARRGPLVQEGRHRQDHKEVVLSGAWLVRGKESRKEEGREQGQGWLLKGQKIHGKEFGPCSEGLGAVALGRV